MRAHAPAPAGAQRDVDHRAKETKEGVCGDVTQRNATWRKPHVQQPGHGIQSFGKWSRIARPLWRTKEFVLLSNIRRYAEQFCNFQ